MKKSFYAYMSRLKHIKRWGLMRNNTEENVAEHTYNVTLVAHALCIIKNVYFNGDVDEKDVLAAALYHEAGEVITGDLPTPIKYFDKDITQSYKKIERHAENTLISMLPTEMRDVLAPYVRGEVSEEVRTIVKAADRLCAYIKCVEELLAGNREFEKACVRTREAVVGMKLSEADYFIEHFLPGYSLTLDELN
ncbi:MAG: 5'-deoxynucleotidase [Christensenella sp.]